jgi:hypothetical protein
MVRVVLPFHLKNLAHVDGEVLLAVAAPVTVTAILDALETAYPMLCGTIREHGSRLRRPRVRFYADQQDISLSSPDLPLSEAIASGREPFMVIGAISGG